MPSPPRVIDPNGGTYHVICRGNNRMTIFRDEDDFERFLQIVKETKADIPFFLHHYVLMDNHVHLLISPVDPQSLPMIMHSINLGYTRYYKSKHEYTGRLWQGRYKSYLITGERYYITCAIYIELNPVRAGMVQNPAYYRWSSHRSYVDEFRDAGIDLHPYIVEFGGEQTRRSIYQAETLMWLEKPLDKKRAKKLFKKEAASF